MKPMIYVLTLMSTLLFADLKTIDADTLLKMQAKGVPVIDIRTPMEWRQTGIIKGAHKMMFFTPRGGADVAEWFYNLGKLVPNKDKPLIIYCAHANRTQSLGEGLVQMGFKRVYQLKGGIENGWIKLGKPTVKE